MNISKDAVSDVRLYRYCDGVMSIMNICNVERERLLKYPEQKG
jgi:hypothetical protein